MGTRVVRTEDPRLLTVGGAYVEGTRTSVPSFLRTKYVAAASSHRSSTPTASLM